MAHTRKSSEYDSTRCDKDTCADPIDPRAFGLAKAAYAVGETLDLLSIGRTSLYAAVKRGDLKCVKFGKKTLFCAADLASFLTRLRRMSEAKADRVGRSPSSSKSFERSKPLVSAEDAGVRTILRNIESDRCRLVGADILGDFKQRLTLRTAVIPDAQLRI